MSGRQAFISHSHTDKPFAELLARTLRKSDLAAWIDMDKILVGENIIDAVGHGLTNTDLLVFIISNASLQSEWCKREVGFIAHREIIETRVLIVPIVIDETPITDLPWHLQGRRVLRVTPDGRARGGR